MGDHCMHGCQGVLAEPTDMVCNCVYMRHADGLCEAELGSRYMQLIVANSKLIQPVDWLATAVKRTVYEGRVASRLAMYKVLLTLKMEDIKISSALFKYTPINTGV